VIFDGTGAPVVTYAMFAAGAFTGDPAVNADNYSATHPALRARARLGRAMVDAVARLSVPAARTFGAEAYRPVNGG
jgi:beta-lactamase class A